MLSSPPPSSKDVFFFLPLSQTSWEGYTALCVQRHSLFIFPSLILSFTGHKERGRGRGEVFHLDKEGHREDSATKEQRKQRGRADEN